MKTVSRQNLESKQNKYWEKVSREMSWKYFWRCIVFRSKSFEMEFSHENDDKILIEFYAGKNRLRIFFVQIMLDKTIYSFCKE